MFTLLAFVPPDASPHLVAINFDCVGGVDSETHLVTDNVEHDDLNLVVVKWP